MLMVDLAGWLQVAEFFDVFAIVAEFLPWLVNVAMMKMSHICEICDGFSFPFLLKRLGL